MLPRNSVHYENTGTIVSDASLQPDILITGPDRAPVVIESEFEPANNVEDEAIDRLGLEETAGNKTIETVIAIRYPDALRPSTDLDADLRGAMLRYAVLYLDGGRFPTSGWLDGHCGDLADTIRLSSVPQSAVDEAAKRLEFGIDTAAKRLEEIAELRPRVADSIARLLGLSNVVQTRRMACAIVANAMIFHDRVAGLHDEVKPLHLVCGDEVTNPQAEISSTWNAILKINYWPIFAVARDIVNQMHPADARRILRLLLDTAHDVSATGVGVSHDLTGRVFQSLIADRKYLATFYTLPASASLLARLAVDKMSKVDWSNDKAIGELRVADFACGTGALLAAVYEQFATRHENEGGDSEKLHKKLMEEVLYGFDVMPSAIHISGATLSGVHPNINFDKSRLYNMPFGRQSDGTVAIGSLEFLHSSSVMSQINTNDPALRTGSTGEETAMNVIADAPNESFDLVIMNPPFTSNTKHYGAAGGVVNAAFAAFGSTVDDQQQMANRLRRLANATSYHGHAGLGSAFAELGHRKLKTGGILALVLPFSAVNGASWFKFRKMINDLYEHVSIVSIANAGADLSFSASTAIAECLIVARKSARDAIRDERATSISVRQRPRDFLHSFHTSNSVNEVDLARRLEDGPYGGDLIQFGDETVAEAVNIPRMDPRKGWSVARILDASVAQSAYALSNGIMWLPRHRSRRNFPVVELREFALRGVDSQLLISRAHKGPFVKGRPSETATYPALWNHDAHSEKYMVCEPDSQLIVRSGMEAEADKLWLTAGRAHLSRDFRFTSQPLAAAFTEDESLGGRSWPNVSFEDERYDYAFVIWCNSTIGMLFYWWHASRQQDGRALSTVANAQSMPTLDLRELNDQQHEIANAIFDEFRDKELKPAYLADEDTNREQLDERVICDLLGFDAATFRAVRRLTEKWCAEPSVNGGKARPQH